MDASYFLRPAFVVGVTGHMDPHASVLDGCEPGNDVREKIRMLFRFLKEGAAVEESAWRHQMEATLPHPQDAPGLDAWPGLPPTPIVVLSSLAPGADSLVAEVALELGLPVLAPVPFMTGLYREASTFVRDPSAPTDAEKADQERFLHLVDRIGTSHVLPVRLADEVDLDESALTARMRADLDAPDPAGRHRRYQAAGEYVASHCDLLLALWDDDEDSGAAEGTGGIVRAKLHGVTARLLPSANAFTWTNCGPVAHLYLPRRKRGNPPDPAKLGKMRWLHAGAFPAAPGVTTAAPTVQPPFPGSLSWTWQATEKRGSDYQQWQLAGNHALCRLARNLNRFNADYQVPRQPMQPLCRALDPGSETDANGEPAPGTLAEALRQRAPEIYQALAPVAAARRHAADMSSRTLRPWSQRALLLMFLLVFVFAAGLHLFSHWHPPGATPHETSPHGDAPADHGPPTPHGNSASSAASGEAAHFSPLRFGFGVACLLGGAGSLGLFWWHRRSEVEERDQDYRALSEGLRVQFAWCLAGLSRSAAAHYMQRQSNELAWIHRAISSLSMPHHRWADWFDRLDGDLPLRLLRWTQANWVNEQARYHERRAREHTHHLHFLHKLGGVLAMAGVWQVAALVIDARWPFLATAGFGRFASLTVGTGVAVGLALLIWFAVLWTHRVRAALKKRHGWPEAVSKAFLPACRNLLDTLVPSGHAPDFQTPRQRRRRMLGSFGAHVPLAAGLGAFALAGSAACAGYHPATFPPATDLITIVSGIFLLAGALLVAWTEKNLLSEQAYQFNTMASLFAAAGSRLDELLREAEAAAPDAPARTLAIRQAQRLLYDLGVEALDENAEWLILHRARPMEPVMAG